MDDAFLLVDKPGGWTSHDVVAKTRRLVDVRKVGHAGTLDPMATGLLVLGLGRATRLMRFVQAMPKEYVAEVAFGVGTTTLDAEGNEIWREPMPISRADLDGVLPRFVGEVEQVPPMVSALKIDGQRLHELARAGKEMEREPRAVVIHEFEVLSFEPGVFPTAEVRVVCGSGTYVRVLADDMAVALGGRAHLTALRRLRNGSLSVEAAHSLDEVEAATAGDRLDQLMLSPADGLADLAAVEVSEDEAIRAGHGSSLPVAGRVDRGPVRVMSTGRLVGIFDIEGSELRPEVVLQ